MSEFHRYTTTPKIHADIVPLEELDIIRLRAHASQRNATISHNIRCDQCDTTLQEVNPEPICFRSWIETEFGNYCAQCWTLQDSMTYLEQNLRNREPYRIIDRIRKGTLKREKIKRKRRSLIYN